MTTFAALAIGWLIGVLSLIGFVVYRMFFRPPTRGE